MLTIDQPDVGKIELAHQALWFDGERAEAEGPAPKLGEHSREILGEAGYQNAQTDDLQKMGAVLEG